MFCRGWRNRAPGRFEESGDHNQETANEKNGQGATRFHGPNLHRPLETMTFENLCGTEECCEAFLLTRPANSSSGLGDLHSPMPWPKSVFCFRPLSWRALISSDEFFLWVRR